MTRIAASMASDRGVDPVATELLVAQSRLIDELRARLDAVEAKLGTVATGADVPSRAPDAGVATEGGGAEDGRTGRRQLLSLAGMAAAGAVAGTTVLASQATPAAAASGVFDGAPAVEATSPSEAVRATATGVDGTAVIARAEAQGGVALYGIAQVSASVGVAGDAYDPNGVGMRGWALSETGNNAGVEGLTFSDVGTGVVGRHNRNDGDGFGVKGISYSTSGTGVHAEGKVGVASSSNRTHLQLAPLGVWPGPPLGTDRQCSAGELVFDGERWWLCVVSGRPGEWRSVAGPTTAGSLTVLDAAYRAYDSREPRGTPGVPDGKLLAGQERTVDLRPNGGFSSWARAALINLTVTNTSAGGGFLKVFKPGSPVPAASAINWSSAGQNIANSATVAIDESGELTVRCGGASAATDFIIDVSGYYM